jgi:hypothetical protein
VAELDEYRKAIVDGIKEIKNLLEQKREIDARARLTSRLVLANVDMLTDANEAQNYREALMDIQEPSGLSDAVFRVLKPNVYMPVPVIRIELQRRGYDMSGHVNPSASIHTTLKRLVNDGVAESDRMAGGKIVYRRRTKSATT